MDKLFFQYLAICYIEKYAQRHKNSKSKFEISASTKYTLEKYQRLENLCKWGNFTKSGHTAYM